MTALPPKSAFTSRVSEDQFKPALDSLRDYLDGLLASTGTATDARAKLGLLSAATRNVGTSSSDIPDNNAVAAVVNSLIETGSTTVFVQATVPTGWVQVTSVNDRVLRLVNTISGDDRGGTMGGSWTITGLSAAVSVAAHAVTVAELPPHNHGGGYHKHTMSNVEVKHPTTWNSADGGDAPDEVNPTNRVGQPTVVLNASGDVIGWSGGNAGHAHPGSTASVSHNGTWRPAYVNVVLGAKS